MARYPGNRPVAPRLRSLPAVGLIGIAGLLAGCGASSGSTLPSHPTFSGDPCSLLTSAELETAIGGGSTAESPEADRESSSDAACSWTLDVPGDPVGDNVNLSVKSPGGAADFASTRAFLIGLQASSSPGAGGSPGSAGSGGPSASSSATTSAEPGATDLEISLRSLPSVGDDAFIGAADTVYAIKGDTELELQLIIADDPTAQQDTIDLLKKALARLP